jgi:hypothetical protein
MVFVKEVLTGVQLYSFFFFLVCGLIKFCCFVAKLPIYPILYLLARPASSTFEPASGRLHCFQGPGAWRDLYLVTWQKGKSHIGHPGPWTPAACAVPCTGGSVCGVCSGKVKVLAWGRTGFLSHLAGWVFLSRWVFAVLGRRPGLRLIEQAATAPGCTSEIGMGPSALRLLPGPVRLLVRVSIDFVEEGGGNPEPISSAHWWVAPPLRDGRPN